MKPSNTGILPAFQDWIGPVRYLRTHLWGVAALGAVFVLALGLACAAEEVAPPASQAQSSDLPPPIEIRRLDAYIAEEGVVCEKITAEIAYLYEQFHIAHLRRIQVSFYKEGSEEKDTLEAPEGYLYLKDVVLEPGHPFYEKIGGKKANIGLLATATSPAGELPDNVVRHKTDIDLIGRLSRRVVYRRADGTVLRCLRAYRDAVEARLYGVGECEMRRPRPETNDEWVVSGETFAADDQLTTDILVRGKQGRAPEIVIERLKTLPAGEQRRSR